MFECHPLRAEYLSVKCVGRGVVSRRAIALIEVIEGQRVLIGFEPFLGLELAVIPGD